MQKHQLSQYGLLRAIALLLIGCVLGLSIYQWNANTSAGNSLPMPFGWGTTIVMSGSMEPTLTANDLAVIHETEEYTIGDIVVYQSDSMLVTHRIIDIQGDMAIMQGDANNAPDDPVPTTNIIGKMVLKIPVIGGIVRAIKSAPGILILIIAVCSIIPKHLTKEQNNETDC